MSSPLVSVLLPVFNAEKYLAQAIESVLCQSFHNFELIVIDDGSYDRSLAILEEYKRSDKRVRLFSRQNKGLIFTLNEGLGYCSGKFIARMDADDISLPNRLQLQSVFLEENPECVAVGSRVTLIDPEGNVLCPFPVSLTHQEIDDANMSLKSGSAIVHPAVMFRGNIVGRGGGYREKYLHAEDIDVFLRLAEVGQLANMKETLLEYRMHLDSVGYSQRKLQIKGIYNAVSDACVRRKLALPEDNRKVLGKVPAVASVYRKWAWWALNAGNKKTARKHAWRAFCHCPFSLKNWKVLICTIRGW